MKWWSIILLIGLFSCKETIDRKSAPDNLIPKEKMTTILTEMIKIESFIQSQYVQPAKYHKVMTQSGDSLLKSFNVTRDQYESSLEYYASYQEELKLMYEESLDELNKELGELQSDKN